MPYGHARLRQLKGQESYRTKSKDGAQQCQVFRSLVPPCQHPQAGAALWRQLGCLTRLCRQEELERLHAVSLAHLQTLGSITPASPDAEEPSFQIPYYVSWGHQQ